MGCFYCDCEDSQYCGCSCHRKDEKEAPDLMRFAGILNDKTADEMKKSIKESRKLSKARMKRIEDALN